MEYAEIVGLLTEMLLEDLSQPRLSEYELPALLEELIRAYEYECQWKTNSAIRTNESGRQIRSGWQTHAASLPAAHSVNRPDLAAFLAQPTGFEDDAPIGRIRIGRGL